MVLWRVPMMVVILLAVVIHLLPFGPLLITGLSVMVLELDDQIRR